MGYFGKFAGAGKAVYNEIKGIQGSSEFAKAYRSVNGNMFRKAAAGIQANSERAQSAYVNAEHFGDAIASLSQRQGRAAWNSAKLSVAGNGAAWKRLGMYTGAGAAVGAGRSYYNNDGFSGYASNMLGGALLLGSTAAGLHQSYLTQGTVLNGFRGNWGRLGSAMSSGWKR